MIKLLFAACLGLALLTTQAIATSKANLMTNDAIGQLPSKSFPVNAAKYWSMRDQAINLAKDKQWNKVIPILEQLTQQYSDDGDTWFLLGHGYLQTEQYSKAIPMLENALQFGTIMTGVKSASSHSNDIMINIAHCYSAIGNKQQALLWIQKSLDFRWDDRKSLINNSKFKDIAEDEVFKKLSGEFREPDLSRNESWIADLKFLHAEIKRLHVNPYHRISKEALDLKAQLIEQEIPDLSDQQIVFKFMQLLASVGNGHNFIVPTHSLKGDFTQLPVQFYWFSDGIYIVKAKDSYKHLIGRKVVSIAQTPVEQVMQKIATINARDNEMQQYWLAPFYLSLPEVLEGLKIVKNAKEVALTLADNKGKQEELILSGEVFNFTGFPTLPELESKLSAEFLSRKNDNYWYKNHKEENYFYVQFNAVAEKKSQSIAEFSKELREIIIQNKAENLVLDLRHNSGGNGSIVPPLTRALIHFTEQNDNNKLFIIVGRNTFSAAHLLLADLNRLTNAIIVGEPSGSRPNHLGEAGWFKLPHSGVWGIISSQYHQASKAEDHSIWIAPHVPVTLSSTAYFSGEDPVIEQIINVIK